MQFSCKMLEIEYHEDILQKYFLVVLRISACYFSNPACYFRISTRYFRVSVRYFRISPRYFWVRVCYFRFIYTLLSDPKVHANLLSKVPHVTFGPESRLAEIPKIPIMDTVAISGVSENGLNGFPMAKNLGTDTKIKSPSCSEPKLLFWPFYPTFTCRNGHKWQFWPIRSIWVVWKWSQLIYHGQKLRDRCQNQVSNIFRTQVAI